MGENVKHTPAMSRELMALIVDEVFDGVIEDSLVIEEIYAVIKRHEDGRLIDAVRDLLEACRTLVFWYARRSDDDELLPRNLQEPEVALAMDAIAKAEARP